MARRARPLASHDCGVALYRPTDKFASFRLVWTDPPMGDFNRPHRYHG